MADAKLSITIGTIEFTGEGEQDWLAGQLDKVLEKAPVLAECRGGKTSECLQADTGTGAEQLSGDGNGVGTLASFLNSSKATTNQVKRFLATSEWLHRKGSKRIKTAEVTKALQDNQQKRLGNPADSLNKNVAKGHCEKVGNEFYVTDEGRAELKK